MDSNEELLLWQGYYQYCNYITEAYRNIPLPCFKSFTKDFLSHQNLRKKYQGVYQQLTLKYQHHLTKQKLKVNDIVVAKVRHQS